MRWRAQHRDDAWLLMYGAVGLTVAYGVARLGAVAFNELRDAIFVRVGQRALRRLALETFTHIHRLSMRYHITRKTGGSEPDHRARGEGRRLSVALHAVLDRAADPRTRDGRGHLRDAVRLAIHGGRAGHDRALRPVHLPGDRMARQDPARDERSGHRCQPEGDRQPAELRDGKVLRRRNARGGTL